MKHRTWLLLAAGIGFVHSQCSADDLFQLFLRGTYYTKNSTGHIVAVAFSEQDLVNQVAQSVGMDSSQLVFVYRPNQRDAAVIQNNGALVASVFQMQSTFTDLDNPSDTVTVRHALLTDPNHSTPFGSFMGLELRTLDSSGGLISDSLTGTVFYSKPEQNVVYGAKVTTGSRIVDNSH